MTATLTERGAAFRALDRGARYEQFTASWLAEVADLSAAATIDCLTDGVNAGLLVRTDAPGGKGPATYQLTDKGRRLAHMAGTGLAPEAAPTVTVAAGDVRAVLSLCEAVLFDCGKGGDVGTRWRADAARLITSLEAALAVAGIERGDPAAPTPGPW